MVPKCYLRGERQDEEGRRWDAQPHRRVSHENSHGLLFLLYGLSGMCLNGEFFLGLEASHWVEGEELSVFEDKLLIPECVTIVTSFGSLL
jgi:hypothetical protein